VPRLELHVRREQRVPQEIGRRRPRRRIQSKKLQRHQLQARKDFIVRGPERRRKKNVRSGSRGRRRQEAHLGTSVLSVSSRVAAVTGGRYRSPRQSSSQRRYSVGHIDGTKNSNARASAESS
jgi:hypothetical protein